MNDSQGLTKQDLERALPLWWSMKGNKMNRVTLNPAQRTLRIANSTVATVVIFPNDTTSEWKWKVAWKVEHGMSRVSGEVEMTEEHVRAAFRLSDTLPKESQQWAENGDFKATVCAEGQFIRYGVYLNIPCPGSLAFGDPNVSIYVTDEMRDAVARLLALPS